MARFALSLPALGSGRVTRYLFHSALLVAFAAVGGALLVWPQWIAREGSRSALATQEARERQLARQLAALQSVGTEPGQSAEARRGLLDAAEVAQFPSLVRSVAGRQGVTVAQVEVADQVSPRWRALGLAPETMTWNDDPAGDVRPLQVGLILTGGFDGIYRTVTTLCREQKLFLPDRWELAPASGKTAAGGPKLKACLAATIFVAQAPQTEQYSAPVAGPMNGTAPVEVMQ